MLLRVSVWRCPAPASRRAQRDQLWQRLQVLQGRAPPPVTERTSPVKRVPSVEKPGPGPDDFCILPTTAKEENLGILLDVVELKTNFDAATVRAPPFACGGPCNTMCDDALPPEGGGGGRRNGAVWIHQRMEALPEPTATRDPL